MGRITAMLPRALWVVAWAALGLCLIQALAGAWSRPLRFDDAFMFWRYAQNLRAGLGVSWNPDGVATYGLTSQTWLLPVWAATWLPLGADQALRLTSWLAGAAGLGLLALFPGGTADERRLAPFLAAALLLSDKVAYQLTTGMDTMACFALLGGHGLAALAWYRSLDGAEGRSGRLALLAAALGLLAMLTRPETGLAIAGVPVLLCAGRAFAGTAVRRGLVIMVALPLALYAAFLGWCAAYYGSALPLSFYAKSLHGYDRFLNSESALAYLLMLLLPIVGLFAVILMGWRKAGRAIAAAYVLPWLAAQAYLLTVSQVMGWQGRFFVPWLAVLFIPAVVCAPAAWHRARQASRRSVLLVATGAILTYLASPFVVLATMSWHMARLPQGQPEPGWVLSDPRPLQPLPYEQLVRAMGDDIVSRLPPGTVVAASEVGYIGAAGPGVSIIDLAGLNDRTITFSGLDPQDLLVRRRPDLIWFPHPAYTGDRARLFRDPALLANYDVYPGLYHFGLAVRRDSPRRATITALIAADFARREPTRQLARLRATALRP